MGWLQSDACLKGVSQLHADRRVCDTVTHCYTVSHFLYSTRFFAPCVHRPTGPNPLWHNVFTLLILLAPVTLLTFCHTCHTSPGELGDTWIHGVASDPTRMADYRAVLRARTACEQQAVAAAAQAVAPAGDDGCDIQVSGGRGWAGWS